MPVQSTQPKERQRQKQLAAAVNKVKADNAELRALPGGKTKTPKSAKKEGLWPGIKRKLFGRSDTPQSTQQSIPYREMMKDGICRVNDRLFTKTVTFTDVNYQLAQNEDKSAIFDSYCDFLNYFDASITVQLTFINKRINIKEFAQSIDIPDRDDKFNDIRREYADMIKSQLERGNNGLVNRGTLICFVNRKLNECSLHTTHPQTSSRLFTPENSFVTAVSKTLRAVKRNAMYLSATPAIAWSKPKNA
jgi:hypothetical protein